MDSDAHARTLARLDEPTPVRLAVGDETVDGVAESVYLGDECIRVDVAERGGGRTFRVVTRWLDGWLDPVVDVREHRDAGFEPAGALDAVAAIAGDVDDGPGVATERAAAAE